MGVLSFLFPVNNYIYKTFVKGRAHFGTPVVDSTVFVRYRGPSVSYLVRLV